MQKTIFLKLFFSILFLFIVPLVILYIFLFVSLNSYFIEDTKLQLSQTSFLVADLIQDDISDSDYTKKIINQITKRSKIRFTIINFDGVVIADSEIDPLLTENHGDREEVLLAFREGQGSSIRFSNSTKIETLYTAIKIQNSTIKSNPFIIRSSLPLPFFFTQLNNSKIFFVIIILSFIFIDIFISWITSNKIKKSLTYLENVSHEWAKGNLAIKSYIKEPVELLNLADNLNKMTSGFKKELSSLENTNEEINTILSSMNEAVIVTDHQGKISQINPKACEIFSLSDGIEILYKPLLQITRSIELSKIEENARLGKAAQTTLKLIGTNEKQLFVSSSHLLKTRGAVIVLNDISNLMKLETIRKDFVANVSHELKTPIQAIKGFAELLLSGALNDKENAQKFLNIILKNANSMDAIIEDLLSLARIENADNKTEDQYNELDIQDCISTLISNYTVFSKKKNINILVLPDRSEPIIIKCIPGLMIQAFSNLIDNALKYSNNNTTIEINYANEKSIFTFSIKDQGIGISNIEQNRIFERFYRIDKSHTRNETGTGLGLSIVKHIIQLHKGTIEVESTPLVGSKFIIKIPV